MPSLCLCFLTRTHLRLREFSYFDIGQACDYVDADATREAVRDAADSYRSINRLLNQLGHDHPGRFAAACAVSGVALDLLDQHAPDVIQEWRALAHEDILELLNTPYYDSLAGLFSPHEFKEQLQSHQRRIRALAGHTPRTCINPGLVYTNGIAALASEVHCTAVLAEGADHALGWRSPNYLFRPAGAPHIRCLLRNPHLSDQLFSRATPPDADEWLLSADRFAAAIHEINTGDEVITLLAPAEEIGRRLAADADYAAFFRALPGAVLHHPNCRFRTPAEAAKRYAPLAELDIPAATSCVGADKDLTPWLGNEMQKDASATLFGLEHKVRRNGRPEMLQTWRLLQCADHFRRMAASPSGPPAASPYDAYIHYMNILVDFTALLDARSGDEGR